MEFTLGIEEELLLVDRETHALSHSSHELLAAMNLDTESARHDLYEAQVELSSSICADAAGRSLGSFDDIALGCGGTLIADLDVNQVCERDESGEDGQSDRPFQEEKKGFQTHGYSVTAESPWASGPTRATSPPGGLR